MERRVVQAAWCFEVARVMGVVVVGRELGGAWWCMMSWEVLCV